MLNPYLAPFLNCLLQRLRHHKQRMKEIQCVDCSERHDEVKEDIKCFQHKEIVACKQYCNTQKKHCCIEQCKISQTFQQLLSFLVLALNFYPNQIFKQTIICKKDDDDKRRVKKHFIPLHAERFYFSCERFNREKFYSRAFQQFSCFCQLQECGENFVHPK